MIPDRKIDPAALLPGDVLLYAPHTLLGWLIARMNLEPRNTRNTRKGKPTLAPFPFRVFRVFRGSLIFLLSAFASAQPIATNLAIYPSAQGPYFYAQWHGVQPGKSYALQFSSDLTHWYFLQTVTNPCSSLAAWVQQTPLTNHTRCFFRMQETP